MEFLDAIKIAKITGLSKSRASAIIQDINRGLRDKGFKTIKGRVLKTEFEQTFGGQNERQINDKRNY